MKGRLPKETIESLSGGLPDRERAFFMELTYGVLRQRDLLDRAISLFVTRPPKGPTRDNLRLAAYQLLFTRVPERAAVHEAVEMEKSFPSGKPALVNAVLRSFLRKRDSVDGLIGSLGKAAADPSLSAKERTRAISALTSHPEWLVKRWAGRLGIEEASALCEANNRIPPFTLRVNTMRAAREEVLSMLSERDIQAETTRFSPSGIKILSLKRTFRGMDFLARFCTPQDEAAQLVGFLADPKPGEKVLDACAAPGGKTTHMAELMRDTGRILAIDVDEGRIKRMEENIERLGLESVQVLRADMIEESKRLAAEFDRVLVDAPCSSLGVMRRNPDVRYRHTERDLPAFKRKQLALLRAASETVRPGGFLVYSTCSTEPEEGEDVIREFLESEEGFVSIRPEAPFFKGLSFDMGFHFVRTWPQRQDMDGFFAAKLRKI